MARLAVRLLGPFEATLDGTPLTGFRSDKVRALLAYLCIETDGPHRREKLAGLLWPDSPEGSARTYLRHTLANLRRVIGDEHVRPGFLSITQQTIHLSVAAGVWSDVAALARPFTAGQSRIQHQEQAVALYRGDLLEGFSLPDSPLFEEWALLHRERLRRLVLDALFFLAESYEERADCERALRHAWRQVELEPWREVAQRQVMRLLAQSGQRVAALAQYETCRRLLADELGVEPDAETKALYAQIRDGGFPVGADRRAPPHAESPLRMLNVPVPLTPLLGRGAELAEIERSLSDPACRLLTLTGPGGIGKTHLALEAARGQAGWFADGVFLVASAPLDLPGDLVISIAQAVGLSFHERQEPRQQLFDSLRGKEMLLLLDCRDDLREGPGHRQGGPFSSLRAGAELVAQMLTTEPRLKILATSRSRLGLGAEQVLPLQGLHEDDAAELFLLGARRARADYQPPAGELASVCRIGQMVGGHPLAILIAAAWVATLTPSEIAAELGRDGLALLEADWGDLPARQRSVRTLLDHSWMMLSAREQQVLQGLAVFRGGSGRQAAMAVTGASLAELRALADKSLLRYTSAQRYEVHELVRQYAGERLEASGAECQEAHARHSSYYAALMARAWQELRGLRQQAVLAELEIDGENLGAAWNWAVAQRRVDLLAQAVDGLCSFFWSHGRSQEGEAALQAVVDSLAGEAGGSRPEELRFLARALTWQCNFGRLLGWSGRCEALLREASALLARLEHAREDAQQERAHLSLIQGHLAFKSDYGQARQSYVHSMELFRGVDNRWGMAQALSGLGRVALFSGEIREAEQRLDESLAIRQALGDPRGTVTCMADLAEVEMLRGHFVRAERLARECHARSQRLGGRAEAAYGLLVWGETLEAVGQFVDARDRLTDSLAVYEDLRHDHYVSYAHAALGTTEMHLGHYEQARSHAKAGLVLARRAGLAYRVGSNLLALGGVALAEGAYAEAQALLQECVTCYRQIGQRADQGWALAMLGYAALGLRDVHTARSLLRDALRLATETGSVLPILWALPAVALLLANEHKLDAAAELYALACRQPLVACSAWFERVAGKTIAESVVSLPPELVASARERGKTRDWDDTTANLMVELAD